MKLVIINGQPYLSIESTKDLASVAKFIGGTQVIDTNAPTAESCKPRKYNMNPLHKRRPSRINRTTVICDNPSCGLPCIAHGFKKHKLWCDRATEQERQDNFEKKYPQIKGRTV